MLVERSTSIMTTGTSFSNSMPLALHTSPSTSWPSGGVSGGGSPMIPPGVSSISGWSPGSKLVGGVTEPLALGVTAVPGVSPLDPGATAPGTWPGATAPGTSPVWSCPADDWSPGTALLGACSPMPSP